MSLARSPRRDVHTSNGQQDQRLNVLRGQRNSKVLWVTQAGRMLELSSALPRQRPRHPHLFDAKTSILISRTNRTYYLQSKMEWASEIPDLHKPQAVIGPPRGVAIILPRKMPKWVV